MRELPRLDVPHDRDPHPDVNHDKVYDSWAQEWYDRDQPSGWYVIEPITLAG